MKQAADLALVGAGGALGSMVRYLIGTWFVQRTGTAFPWGTFVINVTGAFVIGAVLQLMLTRYGLSPQVRLFVATGVLGGYTTFSTYAFETLVLLRGGDVSSALLYALGSVVFGVAAAFAGTLFTRSLVPG